jgi:hypothetical protein
VAEAYSAVRRTLGAAQELNLEDAAAFNRGLEDFIATVEAGRWVARDLENLPDPALFS